MSRYAESSTFRQQAHDLLQTRFSGGHTDVLDSSSTSLHLDAGEPNVRRIRNGIYLYHGDVQQYKIEKLSDLQVDDRALKPHGHILLSNSVKDTYKAFSKAIDQKLFRLDGDYDCVNRYIRSGMTSHQFRNLPKVDADQLCPYYFKHSSLLKGVPMYCRVLPPSHSDNQRMVTVVNVDTASTLANYISDRTVVYLGGNHDHCDAPMPIMTQETDQDQRKTSTRYVEYRYWNEYGPAGDEKCRIFIASPFPNTWNANECGLNVALAKLRNGHFLYWGTTFQPEPGKQLCELPLEHIPISSLWLPEEAEFRPVDKETCPENEIEGAWVLRGDRLLQSVNDEDYPHGILERLRGGFFRQKQKEVVPWLHRIEARLKKMISSFEWHGAETFGFSEKSGGIIECDIGKLATYLKLPVEVLLAFIGQFLSSYLYFQGTVSFLLSEEPKGKFRITDPVPVGPWMHGLATSTSSGLLYVSSTEKYFRMETIDEVSWLSEYRGCGITEQLTVELGQWIASVD